MDLLACIVALMLGAIYPQLSTVTIGQLMKVIGDLEPCLIGIEVSTGAFYWQRQFERLGHTVRIMAPQYMEPFVRRQKNDTNDAESICTAVRQPNVRFVPKKTLEQ